MTTVQQRTPKPSTKRKIKRRRRMIPIWLRLVLIVAFFVIFFAAGAMFGFAMLGNGGSPFNVFNPAIWQHIIDLVNKV